MKKTTIYIITGLLIVILSSCAIHEGAISSSTPLNINCKPVSTAYGTANAHYFLGIGGLDKQGLIAEAKNNMYFNYKLEDGEYFANFSVDFKRSFYLIYFNTQVIVSADIFNCNQINKKNTTSINKKFNNHIPTSLNDTIIYLAKDSISYGIVKEFSNNIYKIQAIKGNSSQSIPASKVFWIKSTNQYGNYQIGDTIQVKKSMYSPSKSSNITVIQKSIIVGINSKSYLIKIISTIPALSDIKKYDIIKNKFKVNQAF